MTSVKMKKLLMTKIKIMMIEDRWKKKILMNKKF